MARRYFTRPLPAAGPATLSPRQGHHLGRLVRTAAGDAVVLFDGLGGERHATVIEVRGREVAVEVGEPVQLARGQSPRMTLDVVCALPRPPRTDWLLEHGTEVGIASFRPLLTARTRRVADDHRRWQQVLIAAAAQCDRLVLPTIEATVTLDELCALQLPAARFVATAAEHELGAATSDTAMLVVGPEGGLEEREVEQLLAAGFLPRSLGPLTLRTETAVLAGAVRLLQTAYDPR